jgi:uncharacterized protein
MRSIPLPAGAEAAHLLVFDQGDEVLATLTAFAAEGAVSAAHFSAVGAFSDAKLGYFDWKAKDYLEIPLDEQVEVLVLAGDIATKDGEPAVHAHVVVGKRDGTAHGGHLLEAHVRPTLELVLTESAAHLRKQHDPETGLALVSAARSTP